MYLITNANGNVLDVKEDPKGLLNMSKTIVRTYDNLNRVKTYTDYKDREIKYGYDELGNLRTLTYPGGEIVTYTYNPDGNIAAMSSKSGGTFTYGYDNYGRLCKISRADGSTETRTYDTAGQLTEQVDKDKNGDILQKNTYTYDVFGEITEKTTSSEGDISKLVSVSMEYDAANRLVKYDGKEVTYDSRGNMIYGPVDGEMTELTYDCRNRLTNAGNVSYTYDCENTRTATTEGGITTEYVTDLSGTLSRILIAYENVGTAGASETHYYYGAEGLACQNNNTSGQYFSYHYDNIGSTTLITDKTGRKVEEFAYGTYGELLTEVVNNIRFLYNGSYGVMTDSNGLYYMRARYYNPDIKRFINQDIKVGDISNGQGLNRYAYCEGNPISMTDPFGLCGENANDQGEKSRFDKWHTALDVVGLFWDGADVINAGLYLLEGKRGQALLCIACALPAVGMAVAGVAKSAKAVIKARRAEKMLSFVADVGAEVKTASKAADTVGEVMETAGKYGKEAIKYGDSIIEEGGATALKLLEKGGDAVQEAKATVKEVEAVTSAGGLRLATKADETAEMLKAVEKGGSGRTTSENSTILGINLAREGRAVGEGEAAAHIVASTGSKRQWTAASDSRKLLAKYDIDINDAANGIPLGHPRPHNLTHTRSFHEMVNDRLYSVESNMLSNGYGRKAIRSGLRRELRAIGKEVENGIGN